MSESYQPNGPSELKESIDRLDAMLAEETVEEKLRAGLGIRLALGMAQELKAGKALGSETAELVSDWAAHYGRDTVDAAVNIAREFLIKPEAMRTALGRKLGLEQGGEAGDDGEFEGDGDGDGEAGSEPDLDGGSDRDAQG